MCILCSCQWLPCSRKTVVVGFCGQFGHRRRIAPMSVRAYHKIITLYRRICRCPEDEVSYASETSDGQIRSRREVYRVSRRRGRA